MNAPDHWKLHANQWERIGPPLRPVAEDVRVVAEHAVARRRERPAVLDRVLLLGVTPELARIDWPPGTSLIAVDRSEQMIATVWPRSGLSEGARAVRGDWRNLPLEAESVDLVIGDGCTTVLPFPEEQRRLSAELHRVLAPGGDLALRFYVAPEEQEDTAAIQRDLEAGAIGSFHCFKWRLVMSCSRERERRARLRDVWAAFARMIPDRAAFATATGWSRHVIDTIDAYRDSDDEYSFPKLGEVRGIFAEHFAELSRDFPGYELGDRCPTLIFRRR